MEIYILTMCPQLSLLDDWRYYSDYQISSALYKELHLGKELYPLVILITFTLLYCSKSIFRIRHSFRGQGTEYGG